MLSMQHGHYLLFMKSLMLKSAMDDFSLWLKIPVEDPETNLIWKELIRVEMLATTVHYAEVFAASLIGMKRYKRFHKFLLDYRPSEIIEFYKRIPERRTNYLIRLLQYPPLHQVSDPKWKNELAHSAKDVHFDLKRLAKFYFKWHDFYNTYKQGLRLFAGKPNHMRILR